MARPLSFKDFMVVTHLPGEDEYLNYRAHKRHKHAGAGTDAEYSSTISPEHEELSIGARRKLGRLMKRRKTQLARARKRAQKRMATRDVLKKRARRRGRSFAANILTKGKAKSSLSVAQKKSIERRLSQSGWQQRIQRKSRRLMPKVRKDEISRKR